MLGKAALEAMKTPVWDNRTHTKRQRKVPKGGRKVRRTLVILLDGTNDPSTHADTKGRKGKNGGRRGRGNFGSWSSSSTRRWTRTGTPSPSPDRSPTRCCCATPSNSRGSSRNSANRAEPELQCGADGEECLETNLTEAFPNAVFFNDFMHAASHLSTACHAPGIPDPDKEFKTCRAIMKRLGAGSAVDRLKRLYGEELKASSDASSAPLSGPRLPHDQMVQQNKPKKSSWVSRARVPARSASA